MFDGLDERLGVVSRFWTAEAYRGLGERYLEHPDCRARKDAVARVWPTSSGTP